MADESIREESWATDDPRLVHEFELPWGELDPDEWTWKTPLRSDFARRQALVEIDVLVAMALGLRLKSCRPSTASSSPLCVSTSRPTSTTPAVAASPIQPVKTPEEPSSATP